MRTYRHEQKYLMTWAQYQALRPALGTLLRRDPHVGPTGEYSIRSLYFDDMYQSAYEEKLSGAFARKKYRVRVYNCKDTAIHLECKYKQGPYICKESRDLSREEFGRLLAGDCRFLLKKEKPMAREFAADWYGRLLRPKVIVDYEREPYVMKAGTVRVTFDKAVRAVFPGEDLFDLGAPLTWQCPRTG